MPGPELPDSSSPLDPTQFPTTPEVQPGELSKLGVTNEKTHQTAPDVIKESGRLARAAEWVKNQFVAKKLSPEMLKSFGKLENVEKLKVGDLGRNFQNMVKGAGATVMMAGNLSTWVAKDSAGRAHGMGVLVSDAASEFNTKTKWNIETQLWDTTKEKTGEYHHVITGKFKHGQLVGEATRETYRITDPRRFQNRDPLHELTSEPSPFAKTAPKASASAPETAPETAPKPATAPKTEVKEPRFVKYDGGLKNGEPHGEGTMRLKNGDLLKGKFVDGEFVSGTKTDSEGNKWAGKFDQEGVVTYGTKVDSHNNKWEGSFDEEGNLEGSGRYDGADGSMHVGNFKDGKLNGYGSVYKDHSGEHTGLYKDGQHIEGTGTLILEDRVTKFYGNVKDEDGSSKPGDGDCVLLSDPLSGPRTMTTGTFKDSVLTGSYTKSFDASPARPGGLTFEMSFKASEGGRPATLTGNIKYPVIRDHTVASYSGSLDISQPDDIPPIPHGSGVMVFENGDVLTCNFVNGWPEGTGTLQSKGAHLSVEYKDGERVDVPPAAAREAELDEDVQLSEPVSESDIRVQDDRTGKESVQLPDNAIPLKFADELRTVEGLSFPNGTYSGSTEDKIPDGPGRLILNPPQNSAEPYPTIQEGTFKKGEFVKGNIVMSDGTIFRGEKFKDGKLEGEGRRKEISGEVLVGKFAKGIFQAGKGEIIYLMGDEDDRVRYSGKLNAEGKPQGKGEMVFTQGKVYRGTFEDGEMHGQGVLETRDEEGNIQKTTIYPDHGTYLIK